MIDFIKWCESRKLPLPETTALTEKTNRSGQRPQYPEGYYRNQQPDAAMAPHSATSYLDLKNARKNKDRKGVGSFPKGL